MRIALVGPAHPYKGGGARHTTELAHRLAGHGHDVIIESWRAQYPVSLYPGQQTVDEADGEPYPRTFRRLAWYRPDGWFAAGRRLRSADLAAFVLLTPIQVPAYLTMLAGLGRRARRRTMVICHNVLPHEGRPGDIALTKALLRRVGRVLVHSAEQAELARSLAPAARITIAAMPPHIPTLTVTVAPHPPVRRPSAPQIPAPQIPATQIPATQIPATQIPTYRDLSSSEVPHHVEEKGPAEEKAPETGAQVSARPQTSTGMGAGGSAGAGEGPGAGAGGSAGAGEGPGAGAGSGTGARPEWGEAGREADEIRLLFFGIVRPYKGLDVLLRALAQAPARLTLTVAGEFWGGTAGTEQLIAELGIKDRVTLRPGYVPASGIPKLFAAADALVLPYREATASQNALLAFAHGVPVITTTAGSLAEHVRNEVDGLTVAPDNVEALRRALVRVTEPGTLARLRAEIRLPDPNREWATYLTALVT